MKYIFIIIATIIACRLGYRFLIEDSKPLPRPGEIWHCGWPISRDVKIDSINRFNSVIYSWDDSGGHKNGLCAMELFKGNKIGEVWPVRDTANSFWKGSSVELPDSNGASVPMNSATTALYERILKRELDSPGRHGKIVVLDTVPDKRRPFLAAKDSFVFDTGVNDSPIYKTYFQPLTTEGWARPRWMIDSNAYISDIYPNEWPPEYVLYYWLQPVPGDPDFGQLYHFGRNKDSSLANKQIIDSLISDTLNPL